MNDQELREAIARAPWALAIRTRGAGSALVEAPPRQGSTLPNVVSLAGYAAAIAYLEGGSPWWAVASIAADEIDGRLARATGQVSELGADLDWAIDITLTGLFADRLGLIYLLPAITGLQAYLRARGDKPTILSGRALMMLLALWRTRFGRLPTHPSALSIIERERAAGLREVGQTRALPRRQTFRSMVG